MYCCARQSTTMIRGGQFALSLIVISIQILGSSVGAFAQTPPAKPGNPPERPVPPERIGSESKDLRAEIDALKEENQDIQEDIEDLFKEQERPVKKSRSLNLLNPQITAFANVAGRVDDQTVVSLDGEPVDDRLFLRTAEFDFRSAIDPFSDGVIILAVEDEAGTGFAADLEEAYFVLKRLPILEAAPLGLKLKLGRFRAGLGSSNRMHLHDMPWTTRPLPIVKFLGSEHGAFFESGFNPVGVDAEFLLPEIIEGLVMELNLDVLNAHSMALTEEDQGGWNAGLMSRFNMFYSVADAHDFNLGISAYTERGKRHATLVVGDFLYKWKPAESGEFRSVVVGGEAFYADRRFLADPEGMPGLIRDSTPFGFYAFAQTQLNWNTYLGARYDYSQEIDDDHLSTQILALYASYYTSEFLRFRIGYEHRISDLPSEDGLNTLLFEANFVIGSHPIEPYWVNR